MYTLWSILCVIPCLALFPKSSSGQGLQIAPISLAVGDLFTATVLGPNIPFPVTFSYIFDDPVTVQSPTTTIVFPFNPATTSVLVYNFAAQFAYTVIMAPTADGPNSVGFHVGPVSQGQQGATITFIGNFPYPITYAISSSVNAFTSGTLQAGTSTAVFNAPPSFGILFVSAAQDATYLAGALITPFVGITVSPSPARIGSSVTVDVTAVANSTASLTYRLYDSDGAITSSATSAAGGTTWEFDAPSDVGTYELTVINGIRTGTTYGLACTPLVVVPAPVIVQPAPGTLLLAGSLATASIVGYDTAFDYTLSLVNGVFAYITAVPGSVSRPVLPVPTNYIGQLYLTAAQFGGSDVATYTISVAQAVYNARNLRRRAHIGG